MDTRIKIIAQARELFNERGVASITMRQIAQSLGISLGNLTYHFQKREDLILALYEDLVEQMNRMMESFAAHAGLLDLFFSVSRQSMQLFYNHRFFLIDLVHILRTYPDICKRYQQLQVIREAQFTALFIQLQQKGWMREAELPSEYEHLYQRMQILGDYWISAAATLYPEMNKELVDHYHRILIEMIYPYFTQHGRQQFSLMIRNPAD